MVTPSLPVAETKELGVTFDASFSHTPPPICQQILMALLSKCNRIQPLLSSSLSPPSPSHSHVSPGDCSSLLLAQSSIQQPQKSDYVAPQPRPMELQDQAPNYLSNPITILSPCSLCPALLMVVSASSLFLQLLQWSFLTVPGWEVGWEVQL